ADADRSVGVACAVGGPGSGTAGAAGRELDTARPAGMLPRIRRAGRRHGAGGSTGGPRPGPETRARSARLRRLLASDRLAPAALPKLDPKLRMIANGSAIVNARRAEQSSALAVTDERLLASTPPLFGVSAASQLPRGFRKGHQREIPSGVQV